MLCHDFWSQVEYKIVNLFISNESVKNYLISMFLSLPGHFCELHGRDVEFFP